MSIPVIDTSTSTSTSTEVEKIPLTPNIDALKALVFPPKTRFVNLWNRRQRSANRCKIDKTKRNQRSLRVLRNARKRQIAQTGQSEISDMALDPATDRHLFPITKPLYCGKKMAGREAGRFDRLQEAAEDFRIRQHLFHEALDELDAKYPVWQGDPETGRACTPEEDKSWNDGFDAATNKYLKVLAPVKPYENRGVPPLHTATPKV